VGVLFGFLEAAFDFAPPVPVGDGQVQVCTA
jgi:hypothetical protein